MAIAKSWIEGESGYYWALDSPGVPSRRVRLLSAARGDRPRRAVAAALSSAPLPPWKFLRAPGQGALSLVFAQNPGPGSSAGWGAVLAHSDERGVTFEAARVGSAEFEQLAAAPGGLWLDATPCLDPAYDCYRVWCARDGARAPLSVGPGMVLRAGGGAPLLLYIRRGAARPRGSGGFRSHWRTGATASVGATLLAPVFVAFVMAVA